MNPHNNLTRAECCHMYLPKECFAHQTTYGLMIHGINTCIHCYVSFCGNRYAESLDLSPQEAKCLKYYVDTFAINHESKQCIRHQHGNKCILCDATRGILPLYMVREMEQINTPSARPQVVNPGPQVMNPRPQVMNPRPQVMNPRPQVGNAKSMGQDTKHAKTCMIQDPGQNPRQMPDQRLAVPDQKIDPIQGPVSSGHGETNECTVNDVFVVERPEHHVNGFTLRL